MCGIVGILGKDAVAERILDALKRLEYRGYDSAGIATLENGGFDRRRAEGKLRNLQERLQAEPLQGNSGIGHTRWATHGAPTERNAHPHISPNVVIVHNGIIENFRVLRDELTETGVSFATDTDTEIVAQLISHYIDEGLAPIEASHAAIKRLEGAFGLAILFKGEHDLMVVARRGSPLAIGHGEGEMFIGSDAIALAPFTNRITYLEDGDWAVVTRTSLMIRNEDNEEVSRPIQTSSASTLMVEKGNHRHFMIKEIYEQPEVVSHTLARYVDFSREAVKLVEDLPFSFKDLDRLTISACGTAFYAGMVAKYWFERIARLPVDIDVASEFRYREAPMTRNGLALFISQSGETADTLAALRYCAEQGQHIASICNVPESTIARESDIVFPTLAGPEIGVASTKAFTGQLTVLATLAILAARQRGTISEADERELVRGLVELPRAFSDGMKEEENIRKIAYHLSKAKDVLFLGRGWHFPIAMEGALKLKEISYIHAEGYASGELKHGPIALIDETMPVIVVAPSDHLFDKTISNMQEVAARGGRIILITDEAGRAQAGKDAEHVITMPDVSPFVSPLLHALPVQLIAYHTAVTLGTDVDQPRNLAKSVTVE